MKVSLSETLNKFRSDKPVEAQMLDKILELERRVEELEKEKRISINIQNTDAIGSYQELKREKLSKPPFRRFFLEG